MSKIGLTGIDSQLEARLEQQLLKVEKLLRSHIKGDYPLVVETSRHLVEAGGKRLRPLLTLLAAQFGNENSKGIVESAVVCELTHLATLYHDDVMDEAKLRRGVQSANDRWGNVVAILTGDYLFSKASDLLADLGPEAVRLQAKTFERLVIGQICETQNKDKIDLTVENYLKVVSDKTASLIATSARFGAMLSGTANEQIELLTQYGEKIGIAFQVADDVLDVASEITESGKVPGTDLREGVPTLITLLVKQANNAADKNLIKKLSGPVAESEISSVLSELRKHNAMNQAREYLQSLAKEANEILMKLPDIPARSALIKLTSLLVERSR
jgi:heptaprenyl diphosphate synthase